MTMPTIMKISLLRRFLLTLNPRCCSSTSNSKPGPGHQHDRFGCCSFSSRSQLDVDDKERAVILNNLNALTLEEMRRMKGVSSAVAIEIFQHRTAKGPFTELEEVMDVRKVGPKSFKALCDCLKVEKPVLKPPKQATTSFDYAEKNVTPTISKDFLKTVGKVTSLEFGYDGIYYTCMKPDFRVLDWNHIPLLHADYQRQAPSKIIEEAYRMAEILPPTDIFLIEKRIARKLTPSYMQMLLFINSLQTAVHTVLNSDFATTGQHKVFHVKDSLTIKAFNLYVGSERVSGQHIINQIENNEFEDNVIIPNRLWKRFDKLRTDILQERYSNSLLVTLAFCRYFRQDLGTSVDPSPEDEEPPDFD